MRGVGALRSRASAILLVGCGGGLLPSCVSVDGYPTRLEYSQQYIAEVGQYTSPDAILKYNAIADPAAAALYRNNVVTARVFSIDANFHQFVRDLTTQQNLSNVGVDWAAIGLASAGTVVGSSQTKAILAAISAGILGAKSSIDKDIFYNKTIAALVTIMEGQRKIVLAQIYSGLKKGAGEYTMYQALADLDNYYNAGSINGALVGLTATAGLSSEDGSQQIAAALSSDFVSDQNSEKLDKFVSLNSANRTALSNWIKKNIGRESMRFFINSGVYAAQRVAAVSDLIR